MKKSFIGVFLPSSPVVELSDPLPVAGIALDVSVEFTPVHNFLPQKSIHAPFILPHVDNRDLDSLQQYYKPGIAESAADALKLGIE